MTESSAFPQRVYLLRHAHAAWAEPGGRDFDRQLSATGISEANIVAQTALQKGYRPTLAICSTAKRCRQTAEPLQSFFSAGFEIRYADELYNAPADRYLEIIRAADGAGSLMLVGHNPAIEEIFGIICGHAALSRTVPTGYPTAGLAVIDMTAPVKGQLRDFIAV